MTGESVQTTSTQTICPHYRVGYCKYKNNCKLFHPNENCGERKCRDKTCIKRHRKPCKFGETCTRIDACEFLHDPQSKVRENVSNKLELEVISKQKDVKIYELSEKIITLEKSFASILKKVEAMISNEQEIKEKLDVVDSIRTKVDQNTAKIELVDKVLGQLQNKQEEDKKTDKFNSKGTTKPKQDETISEISDSDLDSDFDTDIDSEEDSLDLRRAKYADRKAKNLELEALTAKLMIR